MGENITFITGDATCLDLPDNSVDLIITNPPYFDEIEDKDPLLDLLTKATSEIYRVLKPGGNFIIANTSRLGFHTTYMAQTLQNHDFIYMDCIVQNSYDFKEGESAPEFDTVDKWCLTYWYHMRKPGGAGYDRQEGCYNQEYAYKYSDPVWSFRFDDRDSPVFSSLAMEFNLQETINSELVERLINLFSYPFDTVLDPFGGSGIVAVSASMLGRTGITNDISEDKTKIARRRWEIAEALKAKS